MVNVFVAAVDGPFPSVAAPPTTVGDAGGRTLRALAVATVDARVPVSIDAPAARAWRGGPIALPGVESADAPLIVAVGGLLGLLFAGAALLLNRRRASATDPRSAGAGRGSVGEGGEPAGVPATSPSPGNRDRQGDPRTVRTDEEYVVQLLIANHGRMRQSRIVEETDWSKAKVSRLLSRMEEQEQVVRERVGREKVVQLADANSSIPL